MRRFSTIILAGLIAGIFLFQGVVAAQNTIKIGMIDTYTGPPSVYCNDVKDGFKLALDEINAKGGVLGKKLEFVTRDDKFKVDLALSAAKELVMRENVDILAGTTNSAVSLAVSDLAKKEKIPFVVTFGKSAAITGAKGNRYVFSMNENTGMVGRAAAIALAKRPYVKYWIAGDDYEYGHSVADETWTQLKKLKPEVQRMGESWWKVGEPDFTPYMTSILAAKPDAVIIAAGGASCVPFLKAAKATGFNERVPFIAHMAIELSTLKPLGMNAPAGVMGTSPYLFYFPELPENKAFTDKYKKAFDRYPTAGSFCGYISGLSIAKAFEKAGAVDREKFIDALAGLTMDSPVGKVTIRDFDHQIMLPMFVGVTKVVPGYDFLIAGDIETIPADKVITPLDEVKKARGE
jgi:branched-chain amino acid transport system substrate-binding protein